MEDLYSFDNYRKALIAQAADYIWIIRDEALMNRGILVTVKIPKVENNLNEYNDFIDNQESDDYETTETFIEPQFEKYQKTLSLLGQDMERDYPLEMSILSKLHLPRNSIILIPDRNSAGEVITKEWRILSTEIKQVGSIYTRLAYAVPARTYVRICADISSEVLNGVLFVEDFTVVEEEEEIMKLPSIVTMTTVCEVIDCCLCVPYGEVETYTQIKTYVVSPIVS